MRVLVVEDEILVAMDLQAVLEDGGYDPVGPASTVAQALALIERGVDAALLDVNLGREDSLPIAEALLTRGHPFVFLTGYAARDFPERFASAPRLIKPVRTVELFETMSEEFVSAS
jgi:CheY-like chemotaxis protein